VGGFGVDTTNQGGGRNSGGSSGSSGTSSAGGSSGSNGFSTGYVDIYAEINGSLSVIVDGWWGSPPSYLNGNLNFQLITISLGISANVSFASAMSGPGITPMRMAYSQAYHSTAAWGRDHLSASINVNLPAAGGSLDLSDDGLYLGGGPGPGAVGEATATLNVNFGTPPRGAYVDGTAAIGFKLAGRVNAGWAPGTGFYGSFGVGFGYAYYLGATTPGYGGYIYTPKGH
jgi:hypothetical protein